MSNGHPISTRVLSHVIVFSSNRTCSISCKTIARGKFCCRHLWQTYKFLVQVNLYKLLGADTGILESGSPVRPRTERWRRQRWVWRVSPRKFWKIRCNFLQSGIYFWDQNGLGCHSKLGLCRTKNSSGHNFDSHAHAYTPTLPKSPRISATINPNSISKIAFFQTQYTM